MIQSTDDNGIQQQAQAAMRALNRRRRRERYEPEEDTNTATTAGDTRQDMEMSDASAADRR